MNRAKLLVGELAICGLYLAGCTQVSKDEYNQAGKEQSKALDTVGQAVKTDANAVAQGGANDVASVKVKQALDSANGLAAQNIQVDSDTVSKTLTLSGSVPTEDQKAQAEKIATGIAGSDYKVTNKLTVAPADDSSGPR